MDDYDEVAELGRYITRYFPQVLTPLERRADGASLLAGKADLATSPRISATLREGAGLQDDPALAALLADGVAAFRVRVVARVLRESPQDLLLNRCPQCERLARTPKAQQCLWCGHDWHSR